MDWQLIALPVVTGLFSFIGSLAAVKTDIGWIKKRLTANEKAANHTAARLDRHIERSR